MAHIQNTDELEFAIFCIENIAVRLCTDTRNVYSALTNQSDILYHGSFTEISLPDLIHSRPKVDFGPGFYTTPLKSANLFSEPVRDQ